jgi:pyruvate, water dikinase
MNETGAEDEIRAYLASVGEEQLRTYAGYSQASRVIRGIVEAKIMPDDIAVAIMANYELLCAQTGTKSLAVAVRSSGTMSMPGAYETYLNIRDASEVVWHVIRVWGSVFSVQALGGRLMKGLPALIPGIGVAILKMVEARAAGVAFTKHPTTGDPNKVVIEAAWGLGESVVGGEISPDRYVFDKVTRRIETSVNPKTKQVVYGEKGTLSVDVPDELQTVACLTEDQIHQLVDLCLHVEKHYEGVPQDMEWALDSHSGNGDRIYLVQTRNITKTGQQKSKAEVLADMMVKAAFGPRGY